MTRAMPPLWPRAATPTNDLLLCYGKLSDLHRVVLRAIKSTGTTRLQDAECKSTSPGPHHGQPLGVDGSGVVGLMLEFCCVGQLRVDRPSSST